MRRLLPTLLAAGAVAANAPAAASAATVRVDGGSPISFQSGPTMWYDGGAGIANHVTLSYDGSSYVINDTAETITPGAGCAATPDPNTVTGRAALAASPFYMQPFVWSLAVVATGLAAIITYMNKAAR